MRYVNKKLADLGERDQQKWENLQKYLLWKKRYEAKLTSYLSWEEDDEGVIWYKKRILDEKLSEKNSILLDNILIYLEESNNFLKDVYYSIDEILASVSTSEAGTALKEENLYLCKNFITKYWKLTHLSKYIEENLNIYLKKSISDFDSSLKHISEKKIKSFEGKKKHKEYELNERIWRDSIIQQQKEISNLKILIELKFKSYLEKSDFFKNLNMEIIANNYDKKSKKGEKAERKSIIYYRNKEENKIILATFSSFSNITNKNIYQNLINNIRNVDLADIKDIIFKEDKLRNKNKFYTTNAKILVLVKYYIKEAFLGFIRLNKDNFLDANYSLTNNILQGINALNKCDIENLVIVDSGATDSEFLYKFGDGSEKIDYEDNAITDQIWNSKNKDILVKKISLQGLVRETRENLYFEGCSIDNYENCKQDKIKKKLYIENLYKKSLFIFVSYDWNHVVHEFKSHNIHISGGMNNQKILLGNLEFKIVQFLLFYYNGLHIYHLICMSINTYVKYEKKFEKNEKIKVKAPYTKYNDTKKYEINLPKLLDECSILASKYELEEESTSLNSNKNIPNAHQMGSERENGRVEREVDEDEDKYDLTSPCFSSSANGKKKNIYEYNSNVNSKNINSNGIREYHNTAINDRCLKKEYYVSSTLPFVRSQAISGRENLHHYSYSPLPLALPALAGEREKNNINTKRLYSTTNSSSLALASDQYGREKNIDNKLVNNNNLFEENKDLSEYFLNDTSYFFKEAKSILDDKTTDKKLLQEKLNEYVINFETDLIKEMILKDKDVGKYGTVVNNLNNYCFKPLIKILYDFTQPFEINGYKKLLKLIKKEDKSVNFFLLFFVIEYDVESKRLKREKNIENYIEDKDLKFKNNLSREKWIKKKLNRDNNIQSVISIIISIIARIILNYKKEVTGDWGLITQIELINNLGYNIVKRLPNEVPELFLESNPSWNSEDKNVIRNYYKNIFLFYKDSEEFKAEIGSTIFDILINKCNNLNLLKVDKSITIKKKKNIYITISDEFQEFFITKVVSPYRLPMVVFPEDWRDENKVSFLSKDYKLFINSSLVHKNFKNVVESEIGKIQIDTVNFLNRQKFKINKVMLNLLIKEYYSNSSILYNGLNKFKDINCLDNLDVNEKRKILSHNSKVFLYQKLLSIAILFKDLDFYIPTFLDFRGRIYTDVDYLSYQGEDMSRSVLEFSKGCYLNNNNIVFVLQYLANLAGKSKITFVNKEKWTISLLNKLNISTEELNYKNFNINLISFNKDFVKDFNIDFLINNNYIKDILFNNKEKFQFLNLLFNLIDCLINKDKKFHTPISFDATCSGYQHLSGLFRDIELAYYSNVINPKQYNKLKEIDIKLIDDNPKDLYTEVGKYVENIICDMDEGPTKDKFLKMIIDRGLLKIVAMLLSYNSGLDKMKEQIISQGFFEERIEYNNSKNKIIFYIVNKKLIKEEKEFLQLTFKEMGQFVGVLFSAVRKTFPSLSLYINYMKNIAYVLSSLNLTIEWLTPVGMKVKMKYQTIVNVPSKSLFSKKRLSSVNIASGKMDAMSNKIAFMPNFVHSMDSANIQLLIKNFIDKKKEEINLFTVHDCFSTTPNYMDNLNKEVRLAFIMMYFDTDYIKNVHINFLRQIYMETKRMYVEINGKTESVKFNDINDINFDVKLKYIVKDINGKEYSINPLPFDTDKWNDVSKLYFKNGILNSHYLIS